GRSPGLWWPDIFPGYARHAEGAIAALAGDTAGLGVEVVADAGGIITHRAGIEGPDAREGGIGRVAADAELTRPAPAWTEVERDGRGSDGVAGGDGRPLVVVQSCYVPLLEVVRLLNERQKLHRPGKSAPVVQPARREAFVDIVVAVAGKGHLFEIVATAGPVAGLAYLLDRGHQEADEDGNNG